MSLKQKQSVVIALGVIGVTLCILGDLSSRIPVIIAGFLLLLAGYAADLKLIRCPYCGAKLGRLRKEEYCPDCGKKISWNEKK